MRKIFIYAMWGFVFICIAAVAIVFTAIAKGKIGYVPPVEELENPNLKFATQVISEDGKLLGTWSLSKENRVYVGYEDLSPHLVHALVATEDVRFEDHSGIDARAFMRAVIKRGIFMQKHAGGGSTITQQLAKQFYSPTADNVMERLLQKPIEWVIAVKLERYYTKEEILTMYLNKFDFLNNAVGIKTAAKTYFAKDPKKLKIEEAATLIGMCKNPSLYNPRRFNERSRGRRNTVLDQMRKAGFLTQEECDSLQALPLVLKFQPVDHKDGLATYFREYLRGVMTARKPDRSDYRGWQMQKYYEDSLAWETNPLYGWCAKNKKKDGTNYNLYVDGLKIYTTINSRMQQYAEEAVNRQMREVQKRFDAHWGTQAPWRDRNGEEIPRFIEELAEKTPAYQYLSHKYGNQTDSITYYLNQPHRCKVFDYDLGQKDTLFSTMDSIRYMERFMHCGFVAIAPHTGEVKAWVGDINFQSWKYDKVLSKRQPGSTFKLFVYTEAMNQGLSPCDLRVDENIPWEVEENGEKKLWMPHNANGGATLDTMSLKMAFAQSVNTIAANIAHEVGIHQIATTAHRMGIQTKLEETPALSLGASDVSLLELVSAYSTVVNDGEAIQPTLITRVENKDGKVIYQQEAEATQAIPYASAYLMQQMLRGGLTCPKGTSQALWRFRIFDKGTEFGGKTGTSSNHSDAWFVGISPNLVGGAWVGGEYRSIHFRTGELGQGSRTALPVFGYFMEKVLANPELAALYAKKFPSPKEKLDRSWDCNDYFPHYCDSDSILITLGDSLLFEAAHTSPT